MCLYCVYVYMWVCVYVLSAYSCTLHELVNSSLKHKTRSTQMAIDKHEAAINKSILHASHTSSSSISNDSLSTNLSASTSASGVPSSSTSFSLPTSSSSSSSSTLSSASLPSLSLSTSSSSSPSYPAPPPLLHAISLSSTDRQRTSASKLQQELMTFRAAMQQQLQEVQQQIHECMYIHLSNCGRKEVERCMSFCVVSVSVSVCCC